MRILKVSLENLNSLRGKCEIDLEDGPLARAGIFAITGPTGAGKSTILDAITLALYGRAARYARSPDDMMSRHTGRCRAEVEFSVKGSRFRASWHLQKAHGKAHGKLQDAQRRVFDAGGVTLAQNKIQADAEIERLTGLNYERFLRSVLLAQGEFARFLKADANERADLLEQLTGTEIYTRLSQRAHAEKARLENDLAVEERARDAVVLLTGEELAEREAEVARYNEELAAGVGVFDDLNQRLDLGRQLVARLEAVSQLAARKMVLAERRAAAQADIQRLELHRQTQPFHVDLTRLDGAIARAADEERAWQAAQGAARTVGSSVAAALSATRALAETEAAAREHELTLRRVEEAAAAARLATVRRWLEEHAGARALETALPGISAQLTLLLETRRQQGDLRRRGETLAARENTLRAQHAQAQTRIGEVSAALVQRQEAREQLAQKLAASLDGRSLKDFQDDLKRHHRQETLLTRLGILLQKRVHAAGGEESLAAEEAALAEALPGHRREMERAREGAAVLGRLVEALQDSLTHAKLIASFEEQRARLVVEQPCPLCGSTLHPFAGPASTHLTSSQDSIAAKLARARQEWKAAERLHRDAEQTLTRVTEQHRATAEQRTALRREHDAARQAFTREAEQHGIAPTAPADLQAEIGEATEAITRTEERIAAIQVVEKAHENAIRVHDDLRVDAGKLEEASKAAGRALTQAGQERATHGVEAAQREEVLTGLAREVRALLEPFGEGLPDPGKEPAVRRALEGRRDELARQTKAAVDLESALQQLRYGISQAEGEWQRAREHAREFAAAEQTHPYARQAAGSFAGEWSSLTVARERVRELVDAETAAVATEAARRSSHEAARTLVGTGHAALLARLAALPGRAFADLAELRAARLPDAVAEGTERDFRALEAEGNVLLGEGQRVGLDIAGLRERQAPEGDALAAVEQECARQKAANDIVRDQRARVEHDLFHDEENRALQGIRAAAIAQANLRLKYWRWLHALIGSHDGGKFRRFAQGLTLDLLVRHANRHLARLSERYRLQRAKGEELSLNVVDRYQADSERPITSLSGGESFLTSLALALGLSDLAGRNVRIESLFVDEGFGSLDADTLDVAVAALDTLRTSDKMIGIISHVELLKERISTQIRVEKLPGGVSTITVVE